MSGAWPPPAPSVWKVAMARPLKAARVVSTKPDFVQRVGVDRDLHVHAVGDGQAVVDRRRRGAPVLVQLQAAGAGLDLLLDAGGLAGVALAEEAEIHRQPFGRLQHAAHVPRARRHVVASVPCAGPVPPPIMVVTPL